MVLSVKGDLNWCEIFGGPFSNSQTRVRLDIADHYSLIYANLHNQDPDIPTLDIFDILNTAFGLSLPKDFLVVQGGGFFTYTAIPDSSKDTAGTSTELSHIFPDADLPMVIKTESMPEVNTASFWVSLELGQNKLFRTLLDLSDDPGARELALLGVFESGDNISDAVTKTKYYAKLPDFCLLQLFDFKDLKLYFCFSEANHEYAIHGTLSLELFQTCYSFEGDVFSSETLFTCCINATSAEEKIDNPFDGMPGITFGDLVFGAYYQYATDKQPAESTYRVQGQVIFDERITLTGQLYLDGTTPIMASVLIGGALDIGNIFSQCLPGLTWPSSFIDIIFENESRLYYLTDDAADPADATFICQSCGTQVQAKDPTEIQYQKGFNAFSFFTLRLLIDIPLAGNITIDDKEGVDATIQLREQIELWVLQIIAPKNTMADLSPELNGPLFTFNSNNRKMGFSCGLLFFNSDFGLDVTIDASKGPKNKELLVEGILATSAPIPVFFPNGASMAFSYCRSEGFRVTDWPDFAINKNLIDFFEKIKEVANSSKSTCGKIADYIGENFFVTKYKVHPGFDTVSQTEGGTKDLLYFTVSGTLGMYYSDSEGEAPITEINFPDTFKIALNNSYTFESLLSAIEQAIEDAADNFVTSLFDDPEAVSVFLGIFAGKKAAEYAATLICKGLTDSCVAEATGAAAAAVAGGAGAAGGIALTAIAAAVTAATAAVAKSCFTAGTVVRLANGSDRVIEEIVIGDLLLGEKGQFNRVIAYDHPHLGCRSLFGLNGSAGFVTAEHPFKTRSGWKAIDPAATSCEIPDLPVYPLLPGDKLETFDGCIITLDDVKEYTALQDTQLYNFRLTPGHTYFANGFLVHNKGGHDHDKLKPPANLSVSYNGEQICVSWGRTSGADGYQITLTPPDKAAQQFRTVRYTELSCSFGISANDPAGSYQISILSTSAQEKSTAAKTSINKLSTPQLTVTLKAGNAGDIGSNSNSNIDSAQLKDPILNVTWGSVPGASEYDVKLNGRTTDIRSQPPSWSADLTFTSTEPAGDYEISLKALDGTRSITSDAAQQHWLRLAIPEAFTAIMETGHIKVSWTELITPADYLVDVCDDTGTSLYAQNVPYSGSGEEVTTTILLTDLPKNQTLTIFIRAVPVTTEQRQIPSPWSQGISIAPQSSPEEIARQCFAANQSGPDCAEAIIASYPELTAADMSVAMAEGGYVPSAVAAGLAKAYPGISANEEASALLSAFQALPVPEKIAQTAFVQGQDGPSCATKLLQSYPHLTTFQIARCMAYGGYNPLAVASAAQAQNSAIPATELAALLIKTYMRNETENCQGAGESDK